MMNALIAAATADIAGHLFDDLLVRRRAILGEQGSRLHDLPSLTEAALRYAQLAPRLLYGVISVGVQTLDRGYGFAGSVRDGRLAGPDGDAVKMHRTGTTNACAASEFCACKIELIPDESEEGHVGIAAEIPFFTIDADIGHKITLLRHGRQVSAYCLNNPIELRRSSFAFA